MSVKEYGLRQKKGQGRESDFVHHDAGWRERVWTEGNANIVKLGEIVPGWLSEAIDLTLSSVITATWSAFESLAQDLWIACVDAKPSRGLGVVRVVRIIDSVSIKVFVVDLGEEGSTGGLFSVPFGVMTGTLAFVSAGGDWMPSPTPNPRNVAAKPMAEVYGGLMQQEASWRLPRARAGCRDCDTGGKCNDRSPRSPRTSDGNDCPLRHAGDSFRTIGPPTDSMARTQAGSAPPPSSRERELCRSQRRARCFLALLTGWLGAREDRSVPSQLPMGNGNGPLQSISCGVANQRACGKAGRLAPAPPAPRPNARS